MARPFLQLRRELGPAVKRAGEAIVGQPWSALVPWNYSPAVRDTLPYRQGFRVRTEQGMGCVCAPAPASHYKGRTWDLDMSWDSVSIVL